MSVCVCSNQLLRRIFICTSHEISVYITQLQSSIPPPPFSAHVPPFPARTYIQNVICAQRRRPARQYTYAYEYAYVVHSQSLTEPRARARRRAENSGPRTTRPDRRALGGAPHPRRLPPVRGTRRSRCNSAPPQSHTEALARPACTAASTWHAPPVSFPSKHSHD